MSFERPCHYVRDPDSGDRVLIPGCYGTVHSADMRDCYCVRRGKGKKRDRVQVLLDLIEELGVERQIHPIIDAARELRKMLPSEGWAR
jgi:coenzyme F420-reducing hydrogenase delta subunit